MISDRSINKICSPDRYESTGGQFGSISGVLDFGENGDGRTDRLLIRQNHMHYLAPFLTEGQKYGSKKRTVLGF